MSDELQKMTERKRLKEYIEALKEYIKTLHEIAEDDTKWAATGELQASETVPPGPTPPNPPIH